MSQYPVRPNLIKYRGKDARKIAMCQEHNRKAHLIAEACNRIIEETPDDQYATITWGQISGRLNLSTSDVSNIGVYAGGHNGMTAKGIKVVPPTAEA